MTSVPRASWVVSANDPDSDFPLQNLPYGVFRHDGTTRIGVAIGDQILDLHACAHRGLLAGLPGEIAAACSGVRLNSLMSLGPASWSVLRCQLTSLLDADQPNHTSITPLLVPLRDAEMQLPAAIGDYTDFYASIHHATRVGKLFRPDNPLLPNYKYVPIGYHGRASSIVVSGTEITRPSGQTKLPATDPVFGPTQSLDYELEVGLFIGAGNVVGQPIAIASAEQHLFGLCLLNDWSARDIQLWESQPLGPFLAKSFATTISPWIVPLEALAPYRVPKPQRALDDPAPLPHLASAVKAIDVKLEVYLQSRTMRGAGTPPTRLSTSNLSDLYWAPAQLVTHHTSNGCNLRPGDLLGTGTISGPAQGSEGCLLEMKLNPQPIRLPSGELRIFLEDGDEVTFRAFAQKPGLPRIGFGKCSGRVVG